MNKIDEIAKEFHGQYGLTMHNVQILESGLLELYAIQRFINKNLSEIEYYKILSNPDKWALGQINNKLFGLNFLENEIKEKLINANKIRRFLAHRFWWEREIEFDNNEALANLHKEILSYIELFNSVHSIINTMINKIRKDNKLNIEEKMGLTNFKDREAFIKSLRTK